MTAIPESRDSLRRKGMILPPPWFKAYGEIARARMQGAVGVVLRSLYAARAQQQAAMPGTPQRVI